MASEKERRIDRVVEKWNRAQEIAKKLGIPREDVQRELVREATGEDTSGAHEAWMEEGK